VTYQDPKIALCRAIAISIRDNSQYEVTGADALIVG
jgi:hypothetical protein